MTVRRSSYYIEVGGRDVTSAFTESATDISVTDSSGETADSASISVDDTDGQIFLPPEGDEIKIGLGWEEPVIVFEGTIEKVTSAGSRGSGRSLNISAKSADTNGKAKAQNQKHQDDATLGEVVGKWAGEAGIPEAFVHPDLAQIRRAYWSMNGESFMAWGARMAKAYGATFKIMGGRVVMVPRSAGVSVTGEALTTIVAEFGRNLISWSIDTARGRPQQSRFRSRHFDRQEAEWKSEEEEAGYETGTESEDMARFSEPGADEARSRAGSRAKESDRDRGGGSIEIDGEPAAQAEATVVLVGARAGVDGRFLIETVNHKRSRSGGFTTSLTVKKPGEGVGQDKRESTPAAGGSAGQSGAESRVPTSSADSPQPSSGDAAAPRNRPGGIGSDAAALGRA